MAFKSSRIFFSSSDNAGDLGEFGAGTIFSTVSRIIRVTGTTTDAGACCIKVTVVMPVAMEVTKESNTASSISCDLFKSLISIPQLYHFFNLVKISAKDLTV